MAAPVYLWWSWCKAWGQWAAGSHAWRSALVLAIAVGVAGIAHFDGSAQPLVCEGAVELCDRPFDQIAFAATHNSMSSADQGYLWPFQDSGIREQLEAGIRVLLIDTHYWESPAEDAAFETKAPAADRAAVHAQFERAGSRRTGPFLCHSLCGLGHTPLVDALTDVHAFLQRHPKEVITLFFQDAITSGDTEAAFRETKLLPYVYVHRPGVAWPTLRQMIDRHKRLVVLAEQSGGSPAWYHRGWSLVQDTRYDVRDAADFTCGLNRGAARNSLFLLNNWIMRPVPRDTDAATVNSYDFLSRRTRQCAAERGHIPNFIAVDFYKHGDLLKVVDMLNGVKRKPAAVAFGDRRQ